MVRSVWSSHLLSGSAQVPVADCGVQYYDSHEKADWKLGDYVDYITKYGAAGYPRSEKCLYLKVILCNLCLKKECPLKNFIWEGFPFRSKVSCCQHVRYPLLFCLWLAERALAVRQTNWWLQICVHWPKRELVTHKNTQKNYHNFCFPFRTPFHSDVYGSYSWSANVSGKKRWILVPAGQEEKLRTNGKLPNDIGKINLKAAGIDFIDIIQTDGQVIFVPSGWFHQVWNLV